MAMNSATFFLSTGRCGTQWIAENLCKAYQEIVVVEHEPLHDRYCSRQMIGLDVPEKIGSGAEVLAHCDNIEKILQEKPYIECGWPSWGAIPYLMKRFAGRIKIVHLVRHPVPIACSWVSHGAFSPPLIPGLPFQEKIFASPFDVGSAFPQYCQKWEGMNPFEKALFFWAEVNAVGLKLQEMQAAPCLIMRFEELFNGSTMQVLTDFLDLPSVAGIEKEVDKTKDKFHYLCNFWWNPSDIQNHPEIVEVAARLGYAPLDFDEAKLRSRYFPF